MYSCKSKIDDRGVLTRCSPSSADSNGSSLMSRGPVYKEKTSLEDGLKKKTMKYMSWYKSNLCEYKLRDNEKLLVYLFLSDLI